MCGIIGYLGSHNARDIIIDGLTRLEYRGYDSAGLTIYQQDKNAFTVFKDIGRVEALSAKTQCLTSHMGIGHTRWATHGLVNRENAHPHASFNGRFIIVHNGVIENYVALKETYLSHHAFTSQTDTEVIAHLIAHFCETLDVKSAILKTLKQLKGSYALLIIDTLDQNNIYAAKNKPPLLIGMNENGTTITSDMMALIDYANEYIDLEDQRLAVVSKTNIEIYNYEHELLKNELKPFNLKKESIDKGAYPHYMLKEINEQPGVVRNLMHHYLTNGTINIDKSLIDAIKTSNRLYIIAAGTSMHAGIASKQILEKLANIPVEIHIASEFAYSEVIVTDKPFFIFISQSGETADVRASFKKVQSQSYQTLAITNVATSSLAKEADFLLNLYAGPEIAVASTKAYVAQLTLLAILAYGLSNRSFPMKEALSKVAIGMEKLLLETSVIKDMVSKKIYRDHAFYIGRANDYATALEGALKLKEVSYIHTEGFAAGELKHGTIALIEQGTPVIAIISDPKIHLNTRSNLEEVKSRGATPIVIVTHALQQYGDDIVLDDVDVLLAPILMIVPGQLIAYYAALNLGYDIDKPRNLAKSVTVE